MQITNCLIIGIMVFGFINFIFFMSTGDTILHKYLGIHPLVDAYFIIPDWTDIAFIGALFYGHNFI